MKRALLALAFLAAILAVAFQNIQTPVHAQPAGEPWTCSLDNVGATLTRCEQAQSGMRLVLTDIVAQSTTSTAGLLLIRTGTGSNCGTGTVSLLPSAASAARIAYPASTSPTTSISFATGIAAPQDTDLCVICTATNTCSLQLSGYVIP